MDKISFLTIVENILITSPKKVKLNEKDKWCRVICKKGILVLKVLLSPELTAPWQVHFTQRRVELGELAKFAKFILLLFHFARRL